MTRKQAVKAADTAFSLFIRARDKRCVTCSNLTQDCSHVFSRSHYATRWDEENAYGQCRQCHMRHHNQTESYLLDWARGMLWSDGFEKLRTKWATVSKLTVKEIQAVAKRYTEKLRDLT
jgi:5-methylcytosine-specific restriction endonuclease McrA